MRGSRLGRQAERGAALSSHRHSQFDPFVPRVHEVLRGSEVPLRRLDRRVADQQLDLLQFATSSSAQLRTCAATVGRSDAA